MSDRLDVNPDPTPVELAVVETALAEAHLLGGARSDPISAWHLAGLRESVDREPQALSRRSTRGPPRA